MCVGDPGGFEAAAAAGAPLGSTCAREGTVSLLQLRPGPHGEPVVMWVTACPRHQRQVRDWLRAGWSGDEVDTFGTRFLLDHQDAVRDDLGPEVYRVAAS